MDKSVAEYLQPNWESGCSGNKHLGILFAEKLGNR